MTTTSSKDAAMPEAGIKTKKFHYQGFDVELADRPEFARFYSKLEKDRWEPETFDMLRSMLDKDTVFIDIGGWNGALPFWASNLAKHVVTVEPDPFCVPILKQLADNKRDNVTVIDAALTTDSSVVINSVKEFGSSRTSVLDVGDGASVNVPGARMEDVIAGHEEAPLFVKIDIEGYEYGIVGEISKLSKYKIKGLRLAIHPALWEQSTKGNWFARRLGVFKATYRLKDLLPGFSPFPSATGRAKFFFYLLMKVLFKPHPRGTDLTYVPVNRAA